MKLDPEIIFPSYPTQSGLYLLWSNQAGWPVIDIMRVDVAADGKISYWNGTGGTDRCTEICSMFRISPHSYCGYSQMSPAAISHYELQWKLVSQEVHEMLKSIPSVP